MNRFGDIPKWLPRAAGQYTTVMENIKLRVGFIEELDKFKNEGNWTFIVEAMYLNLRYICELIASGCLIAHKETILTNNNKLKKAYQADLIVNALDKLDDKFYPMPYRMKNKDTFEYIEDGFLTKYEIKDLYRKCGGVLHNNPNGVDYPELIDNIQIYIEKIKILLSSHHIKVLGSHDYLDIRLNVGGIGAIEWAFFKLVDAPQPPDGKPR